MKKIIALLLSLCLFLNVSSVVFAEEIADVNISFSIGDDTLMINGTPVTVAAPYIVGEGVTLVPARVITEAFGATVDWDGENRLIIIVYKDKSIVLSPEYQTAMINLSVELPLLAQPEIVGEGHTMVPLRFISEIFGATVGWDDATKRVTVTLKDGEINTENKKCTLGDFSFEVPYFFYCFQSGDLAMLYDLQTLGNEFVFVTAKTRDFFTDLPENTSLIDSFVAEKEQYPELYENSYLHTYNDKKIFCAYETSADGGAFYYFMEKGDKVLIVSAPDTLYSNKLEDMAFSILYTVE